MNKKSAPCKPNPLGNTKGLTIEQLCDLKKRYWHLLEEHPFPDPPGEGDSISMIRYFKRAAKTDTRIGPYSGISVFEAANRIASDLVIINGVIRLIEEGKEPGDAKVTLRLGTTHEKNKGDFTFTDREGNVLSEGEAFNVAASFYKVKLRYTRNKWLTSKLTYILVNSEVFDEITGTDPDPRIIKVSGWDIQ